MKVVKFVLVLLLAGLLIGCGSSDNRGGRAWPWSPPNTFERPVVSDMQPDTVRHVVESADEQIKITTKYSQEYFHLSYPNGDPPAETGACTDVVIRAFRKAGVDLQKEVHEDMAANFASYPQKWGLTTTDTNIDHRRVPNLQTFFTRKGKSLPISSDPETYKPGDVVTWDLDGKGMTHIGLVSNRWNDDKKRYLIIHNIGSGVAEEDHLFTWKITGHYRYF
jgi:uncharacterized protein YijF (DUF1287 family)